MGSEEIKKLWYHTIIFIFLDFLILFLFGFYQKRRPVEPIVAIIGSFAISALFIIYPRFMLRWFRQMKAQSKPGDWDYLIGRWNNALVFGIVLLILIISSIIVGLGISLHKWINN